MDNFDFKKYLAEGRIHLSGDVYYFVDVNTEEDEVEVTYNGESYKSALGDELLFIHYFGDGEYHSENDAPEIFKYLKGKGGELEVDDDEATLTIKMSNLEDGEVNTIKEEENVGPTWLPINSPKAIILTDVYYIGSNAVGDFSGLRGSAVPAYELPDYITIKDIEDEGDGELYIKKGEEGWYDEIGGAFESRDENSNTRIKKEYIK